MVTVDDDDDDDNDPSFSLFSNTFFLSPFILQDPLKSTGYRNEFGGDSGVFFFIFSDGIE